MEHIIRKELENQERERIEKRVENRKNELEFEFQQKRIELENGLNDRKKIFDKKEVLLKKKNRNLKIILISSGIIIFVLITILFNLHQSNKNLEKTIYTLNQTFNNINQTTYSVLFNELLNCKTNYQILEDRFRQCLGV